MRMGSAPLTFHGADVDAVGVAEAELRGELLLQHLLHGEALTVGEFLLVATALLRKQIQTLQELQKQNARCVLTDSFCLT